MDWHQHIERVSPHIVRITTPQVAGTGFLARNHNGVVHIATAAHVVRDARTWDQSVIVHHDAFEDGSVHLLPRDVGITLHASLDSAVLSFNLPNLIGNTFPEEPIEFVPPEWSVKPGVEVGWLGYPYLVPGHPLCFFSGCISAYIKNQYFIDGVAIGGVSGGPAFFYAAADEGEPPSLRILGSITAYSPARQAGGEVLPGLMVADDCSWAYGLQDPAPGQ